MKRAKLEERKRFAERVEQRYRDRPPLVPSRCAGCGVDLDDYVADCETCQERRYKRQRRHSRSSTPSPALLEWWREHYTPEQIRELAGGLG